MSKAEKIIINIVLSMISVSLLTALGRGLADKVLSARYGTGWRQSGAGKRILCVAQRAAICMLILLFLRPVPIGVFLLSLVVGCAWGGLSAVLLVMLASMYSDSRIVQKADVVLYRLAPKLAILIFAMFLPIVEHAEQLGGSADKILTYYTLVAVPFFVLLIVSQNRPLMLSTTACYVLFPLFLSLMLYTIREHLLPILLPLWSGLILGGMAGMETEVWLLSRSRAVGK